MFLQIISILILLILVFVILEIRKIKKTVTDLKGQADIIDIANESKMCVHKYTAESWWNLDLPKVIVPLEIFKSGSIKPVGADIKRNKEIIEKVLNNFNIGVEKMNYPVVGPSVTIYSFEPVAGIKLNHIVDLVDNFTLELSTHPIKIGAPIAGTNLVGIEVPNKTKAIIGLKEELVTKEYKDTKGDLVVPFGRDNQYKQWNVNIFDLPHLLIGGATNTGKSVFINSLIISLLAKHSPNTLRFIFADPKRVELSFYKNLPHLLTPIIMEYKIVLNALNWCLEEMDRRFGVLSNEEVSTIEEYNKEQETKMPYIIFIIDEISDFTVSDAGKIIEEKMMKLLKRSRAVGIHMIVSTSRPCEETYSALLRAYFPARLAFATATAINSKVILDMEGAERLLGSGDALFMTADTVKPIRLKIPYVSDEDIQKAIKYIQEKSEQYKPIDAVASVYYDSNLDELFEQAKNIMINSEKVSTASLQRHLGIGYTRAALILDQLEEKGIVSPMYGSNPRTVLVKKFG
jgi:S-DNA-T family DNA segregation ATPase FtsK/SpoIIIE